MLFKSRRGKTVSKRASAHGVRMYRYIEPWTEAVMAARAALHTRGFCAINGRTLQGKALYVKAKALLNRTAAAPQGGAPLLPAAAGAASTSLEAAAGAPLLPAGGGGGIDLA
eukprot:CAMPEP_0179337470 /NCGR_PEP_ID=MMETSP0797-20121207/67639_1 /TAXON_ID=47934 /ORGANISM="Dinophysis acuminata, Strain DAEP01" /LENGTH=111 /DNA_ID=CAMNT_0021051117 /DNA_START=1 /DNA_END=337 /DNA_ORIENTATION=-